MFDVLGGIRSLLKLEEVRIDNNVFRLHYKATMIILIIFSLLNTSRQYFGDPISCITEGSLPAHVINVYCWITSTFTVPNKVGEPGIHVLYEGVSSYVESEDPVIHHKYYQWVCFILFFQAILFYVPRYLWKSWEGGKAKALVSDFKLISLDQAAMNNRCKVLCEYFHRNMLGHNIYFTRFVICEVLNLINVIGQMFLMDRFLDGEFSRYGWDVVNFMDEEQEDRIDPMSLIFPKVAKCSFRKYGASGTIEKYDNLCILPVNVVNEKMYVFLWFWFIILAVITSLALVYRIITICSSRFRYLLLRSKYNTCSAKDIKYLCRNFNIGDWFIFYQLSHNIDPIAFKKIVTDLADYVKRSEKRIKGKHPSEIGLIENGV